jgi:tetratricopeptide (TPR) repeat protein
MAKLAVVEGNTGHWDLRDQYAKRALDHADRLSPRERFYIEGYYYGNDDATLSQAIGAYKKAIELYPDHTSAIHNLASLYQDLERYDEAIPLYQALLQRSEAFMFTFANLAIADASLDRFEQGRSVFDDLLRRQPSNAAGYRALGRFLAAWGKTDEALAALDKADSIDGDPESDRVRFLVAVLQDKPAEAAVRAQRDEQSADSFARWVGSSNHAINELYRGRSAFALAVFDRIATSQGPSGSDQTALIRGWASAVLLRLGRPALALPAAERALREARSSNARWESSYYAILAQSRLGQDAEAAKALDALAARANALPSNREKRQVHWLTGVMALDHHQTARAIEELRQAESMLPPRGLLPPPPPHVPIWFDLGSAYLLAGDDVNAAVRFQRVIDSTERIRFPIEFVRSLYFLGQIAERRGDRAKARDFYRRFVDYWGDGDVDRDRVAEARRKLAEG